MGKKIQRLPNNILTDGELKFFYERILPFCESDRTSYGKFSKFSNKFLEPFKLESENYEKKLDEYQKKGQEPPHNTFFFSAETEEGNKLPEGQMWFKHLRNAFAHNYITKEGGRLVLRDYHKDKNSTKSKLTLYAKLSSFNEFEILVNRIQEKIENNQKK